MPSIWFLASLLLRIWLSPYGIPESGIVRCSYYSDYFHGRLTANGEIFYQTDLTCASPTLPFGTLLTLRHGDNVVTVRVNDRGPYAVDSEGMAIWPLQPHPDRQLDLSRTAFIMLYDSTSQGVDEAQIISAILPDTERTEDVGND